MFDYDANIRVNINDSAALAALKKLEDKIAQLSDPRTAGALKNLIGSSKAKGEFSALKQERAEDLAYRKRKTRQIADELRLSNAIELQEGRRIKLQRAGALDVASRKKAIAKLDKIAAANPKNAEIQERVATGLARILTTQNELNRATNKNVGQKQRIADYNKQIDRLRELGATEGQLRKIQKRKYEFVDAAERRQTSLSDRRELQLKREIKLLGDAQKAARDAATAVTRPGTLSGGARSSLNQGPARSVLGSPAADKAKFDFYEKNYKTAGASSPVGGRENIPGSPAARRAIQDKRSKRAESMMLGAGFPMLMGGGPAQVSGALLGSTVGTGFGGQILGSAIAQQMQDAVVRVTELQNAIDNLDMSALKDSALLVNAELATQLEMLKEAGAASTAQAVAAEEVYKQFGLGSQASELVKQRADAIKNAWDKVVGTVSSLIALLAQPFIAVLVPILNLVSLVAKGFTEIFNFIAEFTNSPFLDKLYGLQGTDEAAAAKSAASKAAALASGKELDNMQKLAALEKQRRSGNTADAKIANERIDLQKKINAITEEYAAKLKEVKQTVEDIGIGSDYNNLVKQKDLAIETVKIDSRKVQRLIEQNAEHERALSLIKAQSMLENGRIDLAQKRMSMESSIASARSSALLAINSLEMQRATNSGDTAKQLQLQVQRANLIYNQTVLQVKQDQKKAKLAALAAQIKLKELQANVALRQAKGEANAADFAAIELQKQALQLTLEGVNASAQIAQFNLQTAGAIRQQTIEQDKFNATAARAGGGGGGAGGLGGGGGSGGATVYGGGTRSIGSATTGSLARALSAAGVTGTFSEAQAGGILAGKRQARVDAFQAATKGTPNYTSRPSNRQLERAGFAEGGYVTRPTNALIGEGGESEYVIPSSKMNSAMQRYSSGVRGEAVTAGAVAAGSTTNANYSSQQNMYYGGGAASVNITTGPVIRMGNNDYVSMSDLQRGMSTAANAGQANMMRSMTRSYGARRSMGA